MTKDIQYSGLSCVPSDYECPDGALATSLNLIAEDSHLRPLPSQAVSTAMPPGCRPLFFHKVPGQINLLYMVDDNLYWAHYSDVDGSNKVSEISVDSSTLVGTFCAFKCAEPMGNIVAIAFSNTLNYLRWLDGVYMLLDAKPPMVEIEFGLTRIYSAITHTTSFTYKHGLYLRHNPDKAEDAKKAYADAVMAPLIKGLADYTEKGYFMMPFFVRYAYRLYDGSHAWFSNPVLLVPNAMVPRGRVTNISPDPSASPPYGENGDVTANLCWNYNCCRLDHRVSIPDADTFNLWKDIIAGIDIFVSAPIYTFDQSKDPTSTSFPTIAWMAGMLDDDDSLSSSGSSGGDGSGTNRPGGNSSGTTRPTSRSESYDGSRGSSAEDGSVFIGHYAYDSGNFCDHYLDAEEAAKVVIPLVKNEKFNSQIKSVTNFYKVASLNFADIKTMESFSMVKLDYRDLKTIYAREPLKADTEISYDISASLLYSYNNRLNVAVNGCRALSPLPLSMTVPAGDTTASKKRVRTTVYTRVNGFLAAAVSEFIGTINPGVSFPRYLFYPNPAAYKIKIEWGDPSSQSFSDSVILPLTTHDFLNGAYWYGGASTYNPRPAVSLDDETIEPGKYIPVSSKLYLSEVNNPFIYPNSHIVTIGQGEILAISSAARPLSQGQFGAFPLYAFTSEGVWALEVAANGAYKARQPITRDVLMSPNSVCQLDSSVLFATSRGIMLLSGSQAECISDVLDDSAMPASPLSALPYLNYAAWGADISTNIPTLKELLSGCRMTFDYSAQRILVFNPTCEYALVYSLRSKQWGAVKASLSDSFNAYPAALAVDANSCLADFSGNPLPGLLVTRPLKLGAADVLKTVNTVIQRGHFRRGSVSCLLYGSRDLIHWHLVWTSLDHYLRGFRGTPYKYFRIACITALNPDESIFGASFNFEPRLTNHLR